MKQVYVVASSWNSLRREAGMYKQQPDGRWRATERDFIEDDLQMANDLAAKVIKPVVQEWEENLIE